MPTTTLIPMPTTTSTTTPLTTTSISVTTTSPVISMIPTPDSVFDLTTVVSVAGTVLAVLVVVVIVTLVITTVMCYRASRKRDLPISNGHAEANYTYNDLRPSPPPPAENSLSTGSFHLTPNHVTDNHSNITEDSFIGHSPSHMIDGHSRREPSLVPSNYSSGFDRISGISGSSSGQSSVHSTSQPLPRYGYTDYEMAKRPRPRPPPSTLDICDSIIPKVNVQTPTPIMQGVSPAGTEPFVSTPDPDTTSRTRPGNLPFHDEASAELGSTPIRDQNVLLSVLLYLEHQDCDKKDTCSICKTIRSQFTKIANRYDVDNVKVLADALIKTPTGEMPRQLKRREKKARSPHRPHPPCIRRQRSHSTSMLDNQELTLGSSTETEEEMSLSPGIRHLHPRAVTDDEMDRPTYLPMSKAGKELFRSDTVLATPSDTKQPSLLFEAAAKNSSKLKTFNSEDSGATDFSSSSLNSSPPLPSDGECAELAHPKPSHTVMMSQPSHTSGYVSEGDSVFSYNYSLSRQTHGYKYSTGSYPVGYSPPTNNYSARGQSPPTHVSLSPNSSIVRYQNTNGSTRSSPGPCASNGGHGSSNGSIHSEGFNAGHHSKLAPSHHSPSPYKISLPNVSSSATPL